MRRLLLKVNIKWPPTPANGSGDAGLALGSRSASTGFTLPGAMAGHRLPAIASRSVPAAAEASARGACGSVPTRSGEIDWPMVAAVSTPSPTAVQKGHAATGGCRRADGVRRRSPASVHVLPPCIPSSLSPGGHGLTWLLLREQGVEHPLGGYVLPPVLPARTSNGASLCSEPIPMARATR